MSSAASIMARGFFTGDVFSSFSSFSYFDSSFDTSGFLSYIYSTSLVYLNGSGVGAISTYFDSIPRLYSAFSFMSDLYLVKAGFL